MRFSNGDLPAIIALLEQMATARQVEDLLRYKGATFSAPNWESFVTQRLNPALEKGQITIDDLGALLGEAEEHGRQHILLYRLPKAKATDALEAVTEKKIEYIGGGQILSRPRVLESPNNPTWVEARLDMTPKSQRKALVLKQIRTREHRELVDEQRQGGLLNVKYKIEDVRSVNLVKLHGSGLIEVRIGSHQRADYAREAQQTLLAVKDVVPTQGLQTVDLTYAKNGMFARRTELSGQIRYTNSVLRNSRGNTIVAAAGTADGNLFADDGVSDSMASFVEHDGYCDGSNLWFRVGEKPNGEPDWLHVLLSGKPHEFAVTAQCSRKAYENVLDQIREFNKP